MRNPMLVATCVELLHKIDKNLELLPNDVVLAICKALHLESLGILLLEKRNANGFEKFTQDSSFGSSEIKRMKLDESSEKERKAFDDVMGMVTLYRSLGDLSSARGLYMQENSLDTVTPSKQKRKIARALNLESLEKWKDAQLIYEKLLKDDQQLCSNTSTRKFVTEGCLRSMEMICSWKDIAETIHSQSPTNSEEFAREGSWENDLLLPLYANANLHMIVEDPTAENKLFDIIDKIRKEDVNKEMIENRFPLELAKMFLQQDKLNDTEYWLEEAVSKVLKEWGTNDVLVGENIQRLSHKMKRLSQMNTFLRHQQTIRDGPLKLNDIKFKPFTSASFEAADRLKDWDDFICEQVQLLRKAIRRTPESDFRKKDITEASNCITRNYLRLCHFGRDKNCIDYSKRALALSRRESQKIDQISNEVYIQDKFEYISTCIAKCKLDKS